MECNRAAQLILNGVLDKGGVELEQLREHAAHCDVCFRELRSYEILLSGLSDLEDHKVPSKLHANIISAVAPRQVSCSVAKSLLSAAHDNELSWSESDTVHSHIMFCPDCASDLETIGLVATGVKELESFAPPARVRTQILDRIGKTEQFGTNTIWKGSWNRSWGLGTAAASVALCALIYAIMPVSQHFNNAPTIYMGNGSAIVPPTLGNLPRVPQEKSSAVDVVAKNEMNDFNIVRHSFSGPIYSSLSISNADFIKPANSHRPLDTAKAVSALFKKSKSSKQTIDIKSYSVIPNADDVRYTLKENEPVNINSEPEVVASVAGSNVNSEYTGDEQYFTKVAEKVQNRNKLDEWLEKSKSYTEEAKLSKKSANIQILGFKF